MIILPRDPAIHEKPKPRDAMKTVAGIIVLVALAFAGWMLAFNPPVWS